MKLRIDGMGMVCSLGLSPETIYRQMCAGANAFRELRRFPTTPYQQKCGGMLPSELEETLRQTFPDLDLALALLLQAALDALKQGTSHLPSSPPEQMALVLGSNFGAGESQEWCWREAAAEGQPSAETFALCARLPELAAEKLGCAGPYMQVSMSCASGAATIQVAKDLLVSGRVSRVLAVAYDALSEFSWCGLHNLRTITPDAMRPFDRRRSGTIFSEGAAAMLLSLDDPALPPPLAFITGVSCNNNAFHLTAPRPEGEGSRLVMAAAIQDAGFNPQQIDHICAHATSTVANDKTEAAALRNLFGSERLAALTVAAHKSQLGHLLGAASLAEAVITVMAMRNKIIPPTINHQQLDPDCDGIDCMPTYARYKRFHTALLNSAGIGGNNSALVITAP